MQYWVFDYNDALRKGGYIENWLIRLMKEGNTLNWDANTLELVKKKHYKTSEASATFFFLKAKSPNCEVGTEITFAEMVAREGRRRQRRRHGVNNSKIHNGDEEALF